MPGFSNMWTGWFENLSGWSHERQSLDGPSVPCRPCVVDRLFRRVCVSGFQSRRESPSPWRHGVAAVEIAGQAVGQYHLGLLYADGRGVPGTMPKRGSGTRKPPSKERERSSQPRKLV
jgi:hypothetical protein